jgi:prophage maintenance system killer protein
LPVPFFGFEIIYEEVARLEWDSPLGKLPPLEYADRGKILSSLAAPFQTAEGVELYPTVPAKAAALFRGLVKNHGLHDGNKRLAVTTMSTFLLANGWIPAYTNAQLYRYALRVARHEGNYPVKRVQRWIHRNCRLMSDADLAFLRSQNRGYWANDVDLLAVAFDPDFPLGARR